VQPKYKVSDVLNRYQDHLEKICLNSWQSRTLHALRKCRTVALGGHIDKCDCCNKIHLSYNSCRNRHCPTCQGHKREQWIQAREKDLLDIPYFHVVFTIPHKLNKLCIKQPALVYAALFKASWETLSQFAENPKHLGARLGMIALLHTWGQNLQLHPHLHCIVPCGGVTKNGSWKKSKNKGAFLFCVKAMSRVFRAKFVAELRKNNKDIPQSLFDKLFEKNWVVYAKRPFQNTFSVIEYLGRYSHKVAISNHRIVNIDNQNDRIFFSLKNYKKNGKREVMTLDQKEFIRRFSMHILPKGFTRIRHYGILSATWKKKHLKKLQNKLSKGEKTIKKEVKTLLHVCPSCKKGILKTIFIFNKYRPPPLEFIEQLKKQKPNLK